MACVCVHLDSDALFRMTEQEEEDYLTRCLTRLLRKKAVSYIQIQLGDGD